MRRIDDLHLRYPFAGSRMLRDWLRREGFDVGRRHVRTLMRRMGIHALYRRPRTTIPEPKAAIYLYLLKDVCIERPNQAIGQGLCLPRGYPGPGHPPGHGVATVQYHEHGFLY